MTKPELLQKVREEFHAKMKERAYTSPIPDEFPPPLEVAKATVEALERKLSNPTFSLFLVYAGVSLFVKDHHMFR